jgi:hypothetical protein
MAFMYVIFESFDVPFKCKSLSMILPFFTTEEFHFNPLRGIILLSSVEVEALSLGF